MKSFQQFSRKLDELIDLRLILCGLSLFAVASCTSETQGNSVTPQLGVYIQIDRVARPGVKEIFEAWSDHETSNRNSPVTDNTLTADVTSFMSSIQATSAQSSSVVNTFVPDELQANLSASGSSSYLGVETGAGGFGGRSLTDTAMEKDLTAAYGTTYGTALNACLATDNITTTAVTPNTTTFPYFQ